VVNNPRRRHSCRKKIPFFFAVSPQTLTFAVLSQTAGCGDLAGKWNLACFSGPYFKKK
jgi:hypothetical protein